MGYPVGVQLSTLTFSNPITFLGNDATRTEVSVQATAGVVWAATGQPIDDFAELVAPGSGMPGSLTVPFVDQPGFTDQAGNDFTMWAYVVTRTTYFGNSSKTVKKNWQPLVGQGTVDFDNLPGGSIGLPVAVPPNPVSSVAGLTGMVAAETLLGALEPELSATYASKPDNGKRAIGKDELAINPKDYGAIGDGVANDTAALQTAGNAAITARVPLVIPKGTFKTTASLVFDGSISIHGPGTITSAHNVGPVLQVKNATSGYVRDITLTGSGTVRDAVNSGLQLKTVSDFSVSNVKVRNTTAAGMFIENAVRCSIRDNNVRNTLADGIHITKASTDVTVTGNQIIAPGDDCIAVVSYTADGAMCSNIAITGNTVKSGKARGITVIGGEKISIAGNVIDGTASSGILAVQDNSEFFTYAPADVTVSGNTILNAGQVLPRKGNQIGIEVGLSSLRINVSGNSVRGSYQAGIAVAVAGIALTGNAVSTAGDNGISVGGSRCAVIGNTVINSARYGIATTAAGLTDVNISHNIVTDSNTSSTAGVDGINVGAAGVAANVTVVGNNITDSAARTERAIELNANGGTLTGNTATGVTFINVVGGGNIERGPLSSTGAPTNAFYKKGTTHLDETANKLYVSYGATWKSATLT